MIISRLAEIPPHSLMERALVKKMSQRFGQPHFKHQKTYIFTSRKYLVEPLRRKLSLKC